MLTKFFFQIWFVHALNDQKKCIAADELEVAGTLTEASTKFVVSISFHINCMADILTYNQIEWGHKKHI